MAMDNDRTLVLLPGMTADARLFEPQQRVFPGLIVPPWIDPEPREPLACYARRMASLSMRLQAFSYRGRFLRRHCRYRDGQPSWAHRVRFGQQHPVARGDALAVTCRSPACLDRTRSARLDGRLGRTLVGPLDATSHGSSAGATGRPAVGFSAVGVLGGATMATHAGSAPGASGATFTALPGSNFPNLVTTPIPDPDHQNGRRPFR